MLTSQKISEYYERFKTIDVTFTKEIIMVTSLIPNQVFIKCVGDFWPCVVFSSSFQGAKIVVNVKSGILRKLELANQMASLRFCFKSPDTGNPVTFFVNTKVIGYTSYNGSADIAIFNLQYTQRPPDDLIEIMGRILDANINSAKRREERILMTADSIRRLNLLSKNCAIFIQGVPRRCILKDISFSGTKLIMVGVAKFLVEKEAALRIDFNDPRESFLIRGKFIRAEMVEGRKDLVALVVLFNEALVPMGYKIRLNDFLSQVRAAERGNEDAASSAKKNAERAAAAGSTADKSTDQRSTDQRSETGAAPSGEVPSDAASAAAVAEAADKGAASSGGASSGAGSDENFDLKL